jgi:hypothetical protein
VFTSAKAAPVHPAVDGEPDTDHQMDLAWQLDSAAGRLDEDSAEPARDVRTFQRSSQA